MNAERKIENASLPDPTPDLTADEGRLAALDAFDILDTPPERGFDDVVTLATAVCAAPVALVSLVTGDRQWFKARIGFEPCETDLNSSVCKHALDEPDLLIIPDLERDPRTWNNPLVKGEPRIKFYAGAPLRTAEGHVLGSLCVIDGKPRPEGLTDAQAECLRALARQVVDQLELRRSLAQRQAQVAAAIEAAERRNALLELGDRLRDIGNVPQMVHAASEIVGRTLAVSRVGFGHLDATLEHVDIIADWTAQGVSSAMGRHNMPDYGDIASVISNAQSLVVDDVTSDRRTSGRADLFKRIGVASLVNVVVRDHGRPFALFFVHERTPRSWSAETVTFLRNVADRLEMGVARIEADASQRLLNEELSHRMKNTMAMIQAIAGQTLKGVTEQDAVEAFEKRLYALSSAHDVLLREQWASAKTGQVSKVVLSAFGINDRFELHGPDIQIGPRATLSLSLLLHEMATNALKHGALSSSAGKVDLSWRILPNGGQGDLILYWRELGGPAVREPSGRGFGSRLIRTGLVGTGAATLRYLPSGLEAEFSAPMEQVQQS